MAEEEVIEEEVVEISDDSSSEVEISSDSQGKVVENDYLEDISSALEKIPADTPESSNQIQEELIVEEEVLSEYKEVAVRSGEIVVEEEVVEEEGEGEGILVEEEVVEEEVEVESESMVQRDEAEEEIVLGDSWNPGRTRPKSPVSSKSSHGDRDDYSLGSHSWMMPDQKQSSKDTADRVTPRTSHRKSEGIRLEDAINSIEAAPLSPELSKLSFDNTTIKSSDSLDNWKISTPTESPAGHTNDQLYRGEKDGSESDDSSLVRRQKQVQFAGLPEHPPELTKPTNTHLPAVQENRENDSSSSYETDSSAASSAYETDSSASEDEAHLLDTSSARLVTVSYRPSISVRPTPTTPPLLSPRAKPVSPAHPLDSSTSTSDLENQRRPEHFSRPPKPEHFSPAGETRQKESTLCKAYIICLALLLLVGTALCLYFFYDFTRDEHRDRLNFTKEPTVSPTFAQLTPPTLPTRPTSAPTPSDPTPNPPPPVTRRPSAPTASTEQPNLPTRPSSAPRPSEPTPNTPPPVTRRPSASPTGIQPQNNDYCSDAVGPLTPGTSIQGTTENATEDGVNSCDNNSNNGLPGVWYYVFGNGGEMMAHTCKNTGIDSKISIYGGPCSNPECLEVSDNFCGQQSAVSWDSEFQKRYYILVQGTSLQQAIGDFELSIEARYNDECTNAITLEASPDVNAPTIRGQTLEANPNPFVCNGVVNESPSLFYSIRGTGEELAVIFQDGTDFNPKISILIGDCSGLSCVTQSEDGSTQLSWPSVQNMNYYILLHGEMASDVGNFAFQVRSADVVSQRRAPW